MTLYLWNSISDSQQYQSRLRLTKNDNLMFFFLIDINKNFCQIKLRLSFFALIRNAANCIVIFVEMSRESIHENYVYYCRKFFYKLELQLSKHISDSTTDYTLTIIFK